MDTNLRVENFQKICRTCLIAKDNLQDIFTILDILKECTSIQIDVDDGFSKLICIECTTKLDTAYEFRKQCEQSQKLLLDLRALGFSIVNDDESNSSNCQFQNEETEYVELIEIFIESESQSQDDLASVHELIKTFTVENKNDLNVSKKQETIIESLNLESVKDGDLPFDYQSVNKILKIGNDFIIHDDHDYDTSIRSIDKSIDENKCHKNPKKIKRILEEKQDNVTINNKLTCPKCEKTFELKSDLEIHILKHQVQTTSNEFDVYVCPKCQKTFENVTKLKRHLSTHLINKPYKCNICNKSFIQARNRNSHLLVHKHDKNNDQHTSNQNSEETDLLEKNEFNNIASRDGILRRRNSDLQLHKHNEDKNCEILDKKIDDCLIKNKSYSCLKCDKFFKLETDLEIHMLIHQKFHEYNCHMCSKSFKNEKGLKHHFLRHMIYKPYECKFCDKTYTNSDDRNRHLLVHKHDKNNDQHTSNQNSEETDVLEKNELNNIASKDGILRRKNSDLQLHKHNENKNCEILDKKIDDCLIKNKSYSCLKCGKFFKLETDLEIHMLIHQKFHEYNCHMCSKSFKNEKGLKHHFLRHMIYKPYECKFCDKTYTNSDDRNRHLRTHTGEKPILCSVCGQRFTESSKLSRHIKYHLGIKNYVCKVCPKSFTTLQELERHKLVHTGENPYLCTECGKSFRQLQSCIDHQLAHSGERPYSCTECDKTFALSKKLRWHMRFHTGEKKTFECKICGMFFTAPHILVRHNRLHTGERPYPCDTCKKAFKSRQELTQHKRSHNKIPQYFLMQGDSPYWCDICGRTFKADRYLTRHKRETHVEGKPYSCDLCEKAYKYSKHLREHKRTTHDKTR